MICADITKMGKKSILSPKKNKKTPLIYIFLPRDKLNMMIISRSFSCKLFQIKTKSLYFIYIYIYIAVKNHIY